MTQAVHVLPDQSRQRHVWTGESLSHGYVTSGGLFAVPGGGGLTLAAQTCEAYVYDQNTDELLYCGQPSSAVGPLNQGNGTYWVGIARDLAATIASWTRHPGTRYLWRQSATPPVLPNALQLLVKVVVSGGAITEVYDYRTPASLTRYGVYDVTDELYGAVGDGVTDDATACATTLNAMSAGGTLYFPRGTFLLSQHLCVHWNNVHVHGAGQGATHLEASAGVSTSQGLIALGYAVNFDPVAIQDVTVRDLAINGAGLSRALQGASLTRALISNVRTHASTRAGAAFFDCTDLTVRDCRLGETQSIDQYGDGLYLQHCIRPTIVNNTVYDFTRIGIVCEGGEGSTCQSAIITGNHIHYGHESDAPEYNAGIWCEHTDDAVIANNLIENMTNTPGAGTFSRGITLFGGSDNASSFTVTGNLIKDCQQSIAVSLDTNCSATITGNTIQPGAVTANKSLFIRESAHMLTITGNTFHDTTYDDNGGTIVIDGIGVGVLGSITIADNVIGTNTYGAGAADFFLDSVGLGLSNLTLSNCEGWHLRLDVSPTNLHMSHCRFIFNSDVSPCIRARSRCFVTGCHFVQSGGTTSAGIELDSGAYYRIANCQFDGVKSYMYNTDVLNYIFFNDCFFVNACQLLLSCKAVVFLDNCVFATFPETGAIWGNEQDLTLHLHVTNCLFSETHDYTPLALNAFTPTVLVISHCVRSDVCTALTTMTPQTGAFTVTASAP